MRGRADVALRVACGSAAGGRSAARGRLAGAEGSQPGDHGKVAGLLGEHERRAADGRCSTLIVVLRPGTPLPVHDHGSWAVIGVCKGREHETRFRRVDAGGVPGQARLEVERTFVNERGTVGAVPDGGIRTVQAHGGAQAVSIHVYGSDIVTRQRSEFDLLTGTERVFRPPFEEAAAR
jgi:predicted metal-dependent enzyme (double-stranded beta helix superfamily)